MPDWKITLTARNPDPDGPGSGVLEYLPQGCDREDAASHLEFWAEIMEASGRIPDSMDFRSQSPISIVRRVGKLTYAVRADCFERETANGYDNGYGWLRAEEVW